jgi:hypothetical protein
VWKEDENANITRPPCGHAPGARQRGLVPTKLTQPA